MPISANVESNLGTCLCYMGILGFFVHVFGSLKIYHHTTFIARRRLLYTSDRLKVHAGIPQASKKSLANVGEQFP